MGSTQIQRLEFINECQKKRSPFTDIYGIKQEMIIAWNVSGVLNARHFNLGEGHYIEGIEAESTVSIPVRNTNLFDIVDSISDFSTESVQVIQPHSFLNGIPAPGTEIFFNQNWESASDSSPNGMRLFFPMFTPSDLSGFVPDPYAYGAFDIVIFSMGMCGLNTNPLTVYLPYTTNGLAAGYQVAYQKITISGVASPRRIKFMPRRVGNTSNRRVAWTPFIQTFSSSTQNQWEPGWLASAI
jgi:hypothetical protein